MISFRDIVPYVPTPKKIIRIMIGMAEVRKNEKIIDLGSGTGRIIIEVAKQHKDNMIVGVEKSFILRTVTKLRLLFHPVLRKRVQIIKHDFFNLDLRSFSVIFCFLTPEALRILTPKVKQLNRGSRLVSYMFHLDDHQGFTEVIDHISAKDSIYLYKKV
ncbi:class I SAM-dependent methyltransferase [Patescibacteria group bacterium]